MKYLPQLLSHEQANYLASPFSECDLSDGGVHPDFAGQVPPLAPVRAFPPHGYQNRFYQLIGNLPEIVWHQKEGLQKSLERFAHIPEPNSRLYNTITKGGGWFNFGHESTISGISRYRSSHKTFRVVLPGAGEEREREHP